MQCIICSKLYAVHYMQCIICSALYAVQYMQGSKYSTTHTSCSVQCCDGLMQRAGIRQGWEHRYVWWPWVGSAVHSTVYFRVHRVSVHFTVCSVQCTAHSTQRTAHCTGISEDGRLVRPDSQDLPDIDTAWAKFLLCNTKPFRFQGGRIIIPNPPSPLNKSFILTNFTLDH